MTLRTRFILFIIFIHALLFALALFILPQNKYVFFAVEILLVVTLVWSMHLYRAFLKPLNLIASGVETIRDKDFQSKFLPTGQPELDELVDVYNRMIDELRAERTRQREQHYFLERLIHATPTGILILDLDDKINLVNRSAEKLFRIATSNLVGRSANDLPGLLGSSVKGMAPGETRVINLSGLQIYRCRKSHFLDRGFHRHFLLIEELTQELLDTQKRAYTSLIRMMSHEVNNTVGAVNSILDTCLGYRSEPGEAEWKDLDNAFRTAIKRNEGMNTFMSRLASVVRIPAPVKERVDLHQVLKSVHVLMSAECRRRDIDWKWRLDSAPLVTEIDSHQMEQALINIVRNALEAIDENGTITIATASDAGRLSITDTGSGIEPSAREQLFTPFFSTKRDGQGVGLTLVREILLNHGCDFNLEPADGGGSSFWINFPG